MAVDSVGRDIERQERQQIASVADGVAFAFGSAVPRASEIAQLSDRFEAIRDDIIGTDRQIEIVSQASSPGSEEANQALSDRRGEWIQQWLIDQGVRPDKINFRSLGESKSLPYGDSAMDRVSRWLVLDVVEEIVADEPTQFETTLQERSSSLVSDRKAGMEKLVDALDPCARLIREVYRVPDHPLFPDPSADPIEFAKQSGKVAFHVLKVLVKKEISLEDGAKDAASPFIEIGRANMRDDVADARRPLYDAVEQAVAAALDPNFEPRLEGMSPAQRALFDAIYERIVNLPPLDQYQMFLAAIEAHRCAIGDLESIERSWVEGHADGATIARGLDSLFSESKYLYKSNDVGPLFGLTFAMIDGHLRVVDRMGHMFGSVGADKLSDSAAGQQDDTGLCLPGDDTEVPRPDDWGMSVEGVDSDFEINPDASVPEGVPPAPIGVHPDHVNKHGPGEGGVEDGLCLPGDNESEDPAESAGESGTSLPVDAGEDDGVGEPDGSEGVCLPGDGEDIAPAEDAPPPDDGYQPDDMPPPDAVERGDRGPS